MNQGSARHTLLVLTCAVGAWALSACAAGASQYDSTLTAADAAARSRQPEEAARLYRKASRETGEEDLVVEAGYREASMWKRHGRPDRAQACLEQLAAAHAGSSRGPRIWLDLGRLRETAGNAEGARQAYGKVLLYPDSGLATRAADALVRLTPGPRSATYRNLLSAVEPAPALDGFLRLRLAQAEANEGDLRSAITTCERLALSHPLPTGVYSDDALLLAATLRRSLGDPRGALATIEALLAAQEKSAFVGSYERAAFAEARWLAAEIQQKDLDNPAGAEQVLDDLVRLDSASRLRDDALFRAAWLAHYERRDDRAACARARQLAELEPASPLRECAGDVCPTMSRLEQTSHRCRRALDAASAPAVAGSAPGDTTE
jgi:tetratricopeptide (TPR) repeat protein